MAKISQVLGLDFHVSYTLMSRGWMIFANTSLLILLPLWLGEIELGFYYAFSSLLSLQLFFELGMNQVVMQIVAHECAGLSKSDSSHELHGNERNLDRLTSVIKLLRKWYLMAGAGFLFMVAPAGLWFFSSNAGMNELHWKEVWLLLCASTSVNLFFSPELAVLEGMGRVGQVARLRLFQSIVSYFAMVLILVAGGGLWVAAVVPTFSAVFTGIWLSFYEGKLLRWLRVRIPGTGEKIVWFSEVFPFQWRIALSWLSGYFIYNLFVPVIFKTHDAVEAGKFGLALALFNGVLSVGMSWINSISPKLAGLVSMGGKREELRKVFAGSFLRSMSFSILAAFGVLILAILLHVYEVQYVRRFPDLWTIAWLALTAMANSYIFCLSVFVRAHKEEPFVPVYIVLAVATSCILMYSGRMTISMVACLYFVATALVSAVGTTVYFKRYWNRDH